MIQHYTYGQDPNNAHTWDARKIRSCLCDEGYTGYDCSLRQCPFGDDPNTYDSVTEQQVIECVGTGGTFTLTFREETTAAINYNADEATVKAALEKLAQHPFKTTQTDETIQKILLKAKVSQLTGRLIEELRDPPTTTEQADSFLPVFAEVVYRIYLEEHQRDSDNEETAVVKRVICWEEVDSVG